MSSIIQVKRALKSEWDTNHSDYVLQQGEFGVDLGSAGTDAKEYVVKMGDGTTEWKDLPEISGSGGDVIGGIDGGFASSNFPGITPIIDAGGAAS